MHKWERIDICNVWYFDHIVYILLWYDECRLHDVSVNMEGPVVGVSNFVIRGIFLFNHSKPKQQNLSESSFLHFLFSQKLQKWKFQLIFLPFRLWVVK